VRTNNVAQHRPLGWQPGRTWLFVAGVLEWQHGDIFAPISKENRQDAELVAFFRKQGLPEHNIVYLRDEQATKQRTLRALARHLAAAEPGDLLIFYYCGHGGLNDAGQAYFASYDADGGSTLGLMVDELPDIINTSFQGSHALLLADCCYSGRLALAVGDRERRVSFACLASSLASEDSTGNWTFTSTLLDGLGGQAFVDSNDDHQITLGELAGQIRETMAFAEQQMSLFAITGAFDPDLVIAYARPKHDPRIGTRVAVAHDLAWLRAQIVDVREERCKVRYYSFDNSDEEWVDTDRIREVTRPTYPIGATVEIKWNRSWHAATVLDVCHGIHYIQYEGYGSEWNEWVALKRIRPIA
jgi:agenet domain-containing protein/caspase domain-containing protein